MTRVTERVAFRLIQTPCCGSLLCWVNPRLPTFCPECGKQIYLQLRFDGSHIRIHDTDACLEFTERHESPVNPEVRGGDVQ